MEPGTIPEPGELKWGKVWGHPWWPCLVCNSPKSETYVREEKGDKEVHVQFYYSPPSRAWIKIKNIRPFEGKDTSLCKKGGLYYSSKKTLTTALLKAHKAQFKTVKERLEEVCKSPTGKGRKRQNSEEDNPEQGVRPGPSSKKRRMLPELLVTYKVNDESVPRRWKTPFVLMNTIDVPEDLTPSGFVKLGDSNRDNEECNSEEMGSSKEDKEETVESDHKECSSEEMSSNKEDQGENFEPDDEECDVEEMGSDKEDKGENAESDKAECNVEEMGSDKEDKGENVESDGEEEDAALELSDEEEIVEDSDEDPGWMPSSAKGKSLELAKKPKKFGYKGKQKKNTTSLKRPSTSLKHSDPAVNAKAKKGASGVAGQPDSTDSSKLKVVHDNTPTGSEPEIGEFLVEKDACENGNIPFLWRYKRSGLIQKYNKVVEKGKVMYENMLRFSDWWACYANKYEKVPVQVMFKYRNKEKVTITKWPEWAGEPSTNPTETDQTSPIDDIPEEMSASTESPEKTQEEEVSSTTPELEFQVGNFVLDMKDQRNVDNFPIWKIESQILIKKFEAVVKDGRLLHKAVNIYRGFKDIGKSYLPIKITRVHQPGDDYVEVTEETKPKLCVNSSTEESYDKNPLLRHFYVYLQVFLSQALEPGFLDEIKRAKDTTYVFPLGEIDKLIKQKTTNIERKVRWTKKAKDALSKCPYLREVNKPDAKKVCEAVMESTDTIEETVFLFGSEYNTETLKQSGNSLSCQEFRCGKTAVSHISTYHQLCHFKFNLYDRCLAKIKMIRETSKEEMNVTKIMDSCLGNKAWVLQNFEEFLKLVELS